MGRVRANMAMQCCVQEGRARLAETARPEIAEGEELTKDWDEHL